MKKMDYIIKLIAIICFILIILTCIILYNTPSKGYELSIYDSTPITWILLALAIIGGTIIIIDQVYRHNYQNSYFWLIGLIILIICRILIVLTPFIRGYYTWNGDNITHIGYIKDIIYNGFIVDNNPYPITHILLSAVILYTNLPIEFVANYSTAFMSVFFIISLYLLSKKIFKSTGTQILVVAITGSVLLSGYDTYLMPNGWSVLFLPLVFYCLFNNNRSFTIISMILLLFYPFFHPLSSLLLILSLIVIGIAKYANDVIINKNTTKDIIFNYLNTNYILISSIAFLTWIVSINIFNNNLSALVYSILNGNVDTLTQINDQLSRVHIDLLGVFNLIIHMYGHYIIFGFLTFLSIVLLINLQNKHISHGKLNIILCIISLYILIYIAYLLNIVPGLSLIGSDRILKYIFILTPLPIGFLLNYVLEHNNRIISLIVIVLIIISSIISIYNSFISPNILQPNIQVTFSDICGTNWLINNKNINIQTIQILSPPSRFANDILGFSSTAKRVDLFSYVAIPSHFNYENYSIISNTFNMAYIDITQMDKLSYSVVWKNVNRFNNDDFIKLDHDVSAKKIYDNGEFKLLLVN